MSGPKFYEYPVPDGFPAMTMPVQDDRRLGAADVEIGDWEEGDEIRLAELNYEGFPFVWWDSHEDADMPLEERVRRLAKRCMAPAIKQEGYHGIKATLKSTGEIVGMGLWYANTKLGQAPTTYPDMPGISFPTSFLPFVYRSTNPETFDWTGKMGWTKPERDELYSHVRASMNEEMVAYDHGRLLEIGEQLHWYVGPLCVAKEYRGRGVGTLLLQWGIDRGEEMGLPVLLDAFPNARPAYYHAGFVDTKPKPGSENLLIRWPQKGKSDKE